MLPQVIFITGPTSSGKTKMGLLVAKEFNGEIINADARQLFRDAPIGTGVPAGEWKEFEGRPVYFVQGVPHHLMAVSGPDESWTVSKWCEAAKACLEEIWSRNKLPIVVGGTGLYIRALSEGYVFSGEPDEALRQRLLLLSLEQRLAQLLEHDPEAAQRVDLKNPHRVLRALERALSGIMPQPSNQSPSFSSIKIGLLHDPEILKERVRMTIDSQFAQGWMEEIRALLDGGVSLESPLMQSIGFRTIARSLMENAPFEAIKEEVRRDTWQYVRRQMTWLRKEPALKWVKNEGEAIAHLSSRTEEELR